MPRTNESREKILAAARDVFAAKGFERTTIDEIADAAGVAKGTVYYSFTSKSALYAGVISDGVAWLKAETAKHAEECGPFLVRMTAIVRTLTDLFLDYTEFVAVFFIDAPHGLDATDTQRIDEERRRLLEFYRGLFAQGIEHGLLRRVDPGMAASGLLALLFSLCRDHGGGDRDRARRNILAFVQTLLSEGIILSEGAPYGQ
jgi:AcrR family transcriptional regulator